MKKIVIDEIPDDGLFLEIQEKIKIDEIKVIKPVNACFTITKEKYEVIINGSMNADVELECSRCLKNFTKTLDVPVNVVYQQMIGFGEEVHELRRDEMDLEFYQGNEIDLHNLLKEQIILNLTMKPLCSEDCKGICPHCGTDLNKWICDCKELDVDPRLEILKTLLNKRKE